MRYQRFKNAAAADAADAAGPLCAPRGNEEERPKISSGHEVDAHLDMKSMRNYKKYMRTEEVEAFAYMLDTPIYTCVESRGQYFWQRLPHPSSPANVSCDCGIYLLNENVHFLLVLSP